MSQKCKIHEGEIDVLDKWYLFCFLFIIIIVVVGLLNSCQLTERVPIVDICCRVRTVVRKVLFTHSCFVVIPPLSVAPDT